MDAAHCIDSANGVRQGDPLSSLLFCLYVKPAIDALVADVHFGSRINVYAYVDDVHIVGEVDDVLAAHTVFVQHLRDIELTVNAAKCSLLYFHAATHPLTAAQCQLVHTVGLQWDASLSAAADVLGAVIGIDAAVIAQRLQSKSGGASGLFGAFFRRVRSGGFSVQSAMLLLAHTVSRLAYMQRCLPPEAMQQVSTEWDALLMSAATHVLDLAAHERTAAVMETLQRPRRLGGFGLLSAVCVSPFAFLASVAASAAQPVVTRFLTSCPLLHSCTSGWTLHSPVHLRTLYARRTTCLLCTTRLPPSPLTTTPSLHRLSASNPGSCLRRTTLCITPD